MIYAKQVNKRIMLTEKIENITIFQNSYHFYFMNFTTYFVLDQF